jgi:undecaprenyl-diphosphatase
MSFWQAIFLAIIQGLTEFLPVSSSGHLVIFQKLFGLRPPVLFDVLVHVGTLAAVLIYFRQQWGEISGRLLRLVAIGTIPIIITGLWLQSYLDYLFGSIKLVAVALLVTAFLLFSTRKLKGKQSLKQAGWFDVFTVGLFQALAILPGVSRSGATITAGLWRKFYRQAAFRFSFFLAIPAILGALVLQIPDLLVSPCGYFPQAALGMLTAGVVGYGALKALEKFLLGAKLWLFGFYCLGLGLCLLFI